MDICVSGCLDVMVSTVQRPPFVKGEGGGRDLKNGSEGG